MPIDTDIALLLERLAVTEAPASLDALRRATDTTLRGWHGPLEAVDHTETFAVPTRDGQQIRVRAYWPSVAAESAARRPALVYAHGGGWCLGTLELYDNPCRALANATQCVVLSVDYRLAPEHRFPVPLEDFCDALDWWCARRPAWGWTRRASPSAATVQEETLRRLPVWSHVGGAARRSRISCCCIRRWMRR